MIATVRFHRLAAAFLLLGLAVLAVPALARADQRIYWVNAGSGSVSFSGLDGTGGGNLATGDAQIEHPQGLAFDSSGQRLFWGSHGFPNQKIGFADLVGPATGNFDTGGQRIEFPSSIAVDPVGQTLYWTGGERLLEAPLDGAGGAPVKSGGTEVAGASAVVVDPPSGRLYWTTNEEGKPIAFANLDGSGTVTKLAIAGEAGESGTSGIAIDHLNGRVYWANRFDSKIWSANLDGSDVRRLNTGTATLKFPSGLALDPAAGRIYWGNEIGDRVSVARLDESGGEDLATPGTTPAGPSSPILLYAPRSLAAPEVTGGARVGTVLTCSTGTWAGDLNESSLYQSPGSFGFQWTRDGSDIAGATGATLAATAPSSDYGCRVTARNAAGSATASSGPHAVAAVGAVPVPAPGFGGEARVSLALATPRIGAKSPVTVRIVNQNPFLVAGTIEAREVIPKKVKKGKRPRKPPKAFPAGFEVAANSEATVALRLPAVTQKLLAEQGKVTLALSGSVADLADARRPLAQRIVVKSTAKPKPKPKHKPKAGSR
jgi:hypothetical protein